MATPLRRSPRVSQGTVQPVVEASPSSKSLGKRKAVSPVPEVPIQAEGSTNKKTKPSDRKLRSSLAPIPATKTAPNSMSSRKGSRASRAAKAKARAHDDHSADPHDAEERDSEMNSTVQGNSLHQSESELPSDDHMDEHISYREDTGVSVPGEDDDDSGDDDSNSDSNEDDHDDDDDDEEEAEAEAAAQAQYEADLHADEFGSGHEDDLSDLLGAVQRFDGSNGAQTGPGVAHGTQSAAALEAAMDAAENAALDAAAARQYLSGLSGGGGAGFRALHGMMSGMSNRLKTILTSLRSKDGDASAKLTALQDLAELLSVSTEDTLSGYFQVEAFTKEIVEILKGDNVIIPGAGGSEDGGMTAAEMLAFGIEPGSQGGGDGGSAEESNVQMMLLACRCLANLMEALPGSAHSVVYAGAVPVLCSKLQDIQYIDLAEQTLQTLEKISEEVPSAIVRAGGLSALLTYLDFFSFHVQRTAVTAAANCCRSLSLDSFNMVKDVMPIIKNVLSYPDQRVVEQACLAVVKIVDSYRHYPDKLEALLSTELLASMRTLLNPDSTTVGSGTYTQILKMLSTASKASPLVAIGLVELNIGNTLYHLLTGVSAPEFKGDQGIQVVGRLGDEADMLVMQNLVQRPKEQIQETLALVCELLPPLPKDGIFDSRAFSTKDRSSKVKVKTEDIKVEEGTPALPVASTSTSIDANDATVDVKMENADDAAFAVSVPVTRVSSRSRRDPAKEALVEKRLELLNSGPASRTLIVKRYFALILPALIDVYSASVNGHVRAKAVLGMTKIINFCDQENLASILKGLPISSFLAAILASRDQATLITSALQLVELLLIKLPDEYSYFFRREGVMHEIERIAAQPIFTPPKSKRVSPSRTPKVEPSSGDAGPSGLTRALLQHVDASSASSPATTLAPADALAKDMITRRAIHICDVYISVDSEPTLKARAALETVEQLVSRLDQVSTGLNRDATDIAKIVVQVVSLFSDEQNPLSSFELLQSGFVESVLKFATLAGSDRLSTSDCQELLANGFMPQLQGGAATPAFSVLVKRLQESLSRMEEFEVTLAGQGTSEVESRRNGPSMLARQLKLRLMADDDSDIPRSCSNVVVSIHAIATFQAFNDYLRPRILAASALAERVSGNSGASSGAGRLSGFLAAFAAAAEDSAGASGSEQLMSTSLGTTEIPVPSSTKSTDEPKRRRSSRLSRLSRDGASPVPEPTTSAADNAAAPDADTSTLGYDDVDDEELFADDFDPAPPSRDERPVNLEVTDDGSKVVVKTPDGTRVSTPTPNKTTPRSSTSKPRASYAAAVKAEPTDFHLEFSMGDQDVGLDTTVFGAVHNFDARSPANRRSMWTNIYTVKFRKVAGPARSDSEPATPEPSSRDDSTMVLPESIPAHSQQAMILQLLCVLHTINSDHGDGSVLNEFGVPIVGLSEGAFINNKLTAKLNRQLEEPMIVASACLPDWSVDLPQFFPFLFPFDTRYTFLQSTAFGYARLMQKWVGQARVESSRRDENLGFLGRLQRQKVRISREQMLESAFKVFELYGASRASLEVEFFAEVGSGLGPTLEFYALVSKEFARRDLVLWREGDASNVSEFVYNLSGLFPSPTEDFTSAIGKKRLEVFRVLGQFVAKALMDSRIIDVQFSKTFMRLVLDIDLPLTIASVSTVDKDLARSLAHLQSYVTIKALIAGQAALSDDAKAIEVAAITVDDVKITDLFLDFTLPGYSIDLKPGGKTIAVDMSNLEEYISLVIEWTLQKGIVAQVKQFKAGFTTVFPVRDLQSFTALELVSMTGAIDEDWSIEGLTNSTKADHGFTMDSRPVRDVLSIMSQLTLLERREFLSFITGSPRLPIGGFAALTPSLTIVRKDGGDGSLPSVMTCVNYIKLPDYTTREITKTRFFTAMSEGSGGFHLS